MASRSCVSEVQCNSATNRRVFDEVSLKSLEFPEIRNGPTRESASPGHAKMERELIHVPFRNAVIRRLVKKKASHPTQADEIYSPRDWQRVCLYGFVCRSLNLGMGVLMRNLGRSLVLLVIGGVCCADVCLAQELPKRAGTHNRVLAALTWPVRAYYIETKETLRDMRQDQLLRTEAVALFGSAAFENAGLEYAYRQNPTSTIGYPGRLFFGHRPHGVQLWLVSGAANLALLDAAHHLSRHTKHHPDGDGFTKYGSLTGIVGLSTWYTVAGIHNLNVKSPPLSLHSSPNNAQH
jgi:hypothetical protein